MKIGGFQKCKIYFSSKKGLRITAWQSWFKFTETRIRTWAEKSEMAKKAWVHYVRILMTNDRKIIHPQFLFPGFQNSNRNQGKKEFLNSHDGQKSYLLTCTSHSAHVGWRAGSGQQVTFCPSWEFKNYFFSWFLLLFRRPEKRNCECRGWYKLSGLPYILPCIAPTMNFYFRMS